MNPRIVNPASSVLPRQLHRLNPATEGAGSASQAPAGEFEDGTRRWRGRRGRRKGFRPQGGRAVRSSQPRSSQA